MVIHILGGAIPVLRTPGHYAKFIPLLIVPTTTRSKRFFLDTGLTGKVYNINMSHSFVGVVTFFRLREAG